MNRLGTYTLIRLIRVVPYVKDIVLTVSNVFLSFTKEFLHVLRDHLMQFLAYRQLILPQKVFNGPHAISTGELSLFHLLESPTKVIRDPLL